MGLLYLLLGVFLGLLLALFILRKRASNEAATRSELLRLASDNARWQERAQAADTQVQTLRLELENVRASLLEASRAHATEVERNKALEQRLAQHQNEFTAAQAQLRTEFENLANRLLEEKAAKFTQHNQTQLDLLLKPFQERLADLRSLLQSSHDAETRDRVTLQTQIKSLVDLNQKLSAEASNLTRALKGQSQAQGAWGELVLETVLERSGLTRDVEFIVQPTFTNEEQQRLRPDILINLPEGKNLIIDSKVSLAAYESYCSASTDEQRATALDAHLLSLQTHLKGLSEKRYHTLYQIQTPDFVLLFVPIESAFSLALQHRPQLFQEALEMNIVIVTPTTLLATLRTVANLWKFEKQNRNALEIARQAGGLLDKFTELCGAVEEVSQRLDQAHKAQVKVTERLRDGRGNLLKRAHDIAKLGAKASKTLPALETEEEDQPALPSQ